MTEKIAQLKVWVDQASAIVFFGGAGVSTESGLKDFRSPDGIYNECLGTKAPVSAESGIPDFRSTGGLYHQEWKDPPEEILSHTYYKSNPEEFFRFYRAKMLAPEARPNAAHRKLAQWEAQGKLKAVVTQNIDGLHQAAGIKCVL